MSIMHLKGMRQTRDIALSLLLTMFTKIYRQLSRIPPRAYAIFAELLLIITGATLVIFDLTYTPDPLYTVRFGDFYTYLALGGLIAVWSVFGLLATSKVST
ncbi:hypothetical protein BJV82DRAFT_277611 [Fennellomyces sp. T-0311]|nr:hypothetical protein BJV82DRAFT_277611 [Fennellomyces sp. T-0311]